jgi:hypothetical protein
LPLAANLSISRAPCTSRSLRALRALRLAVQDIALSRRKHGFESRRARQGDQALSRHRPAGVQQVTNKRLLIRFALCPVSLRAAGRKNAGAATAGPARACWEIMRQQITFSHHERNTGVAWLSFQPDGSISCGLRDRTYVAPEMRLRIGIWSAYNRVDLAFRVPTATETLLPVENPHFTYHPPGIFHLKDDDARSANDEDLFKGFADVSIVLQQQTQMPWLRITSGPLADLPVAGPARADAVTNSEFIHTVPVVVTAASAEVEIDFIRKQDVNAAPHTSVRELVWHDVGLRIRAGFVAPQIATLFWFHFC